MAFVIERKEQFGTDTSIYNKLFYNSRGQLAEVRDSTTPNDASWNRGAIINHYSDYCWGMCGGSNSTTSMPENNGNLKNQDIYIPNNDQVSSYVTWRDHFDYDPLNRLQRVHEETPSDSQQEYVYDRWGNRTIHQTNTWGVGIPKPNFGVDPTTNRLTPPAGYTMSFDNAGNLTNDTYTGQGQRVYDAENRMTQAWANGQWQVYSYDSDGHRVKRKVNNVETWQVYGIGGELVAEYAPNAPANTPDKEYGYRNGQLLVTASAVNLAQGKTATQSSTFYIMYASLAVDGNTNGDFWGAMSSATADYGYQDWWQVDLGSSQSIGQIQVWPRTDCCPEHTANFYVLVSDNPFTSTDLNTTLNQAGVSNYWVAGNNATAATVNVNRTGRYVRIQRSDSQYLVLAEVKVLASSADVNWLVTDQLGTPRMIFDKTGSLANTKRHDYLPFGEELIAGQGLRTTALGYVADNTRQKFTLKERDNETGLDYFGERYYSSTQGRFTIVDPLGGSARMSNPQTMNRYTFVLNNPLRYVDPNGLKEKEPWDQLNSEEQHALITKLVKLKDPRRATLKEQAAAAKRFKELVSVDGNPQATAGRIATAKSLVAEFMSHGQMPRNDPAWRQVDEIKGIGQSTVEVTVKGKDKFLGGLAADGYAVNDGSEDVAKAWSRLKNGRADHPNDNARAYTYDGEDPELHFMNDDAGKPNYFSAHWDNDSVHCQSGCGPAGQLINGNKHAEGFASPGQVTNYYKQHPTAPVRQ
jgi:RHS repeat-associated protein